MSKNVCVFRQAAEIASRGYDRTHAAFGFAVLRAGIVAKDTMAGIFGIQESQLGKALNSGNFRPNDVRQLAQVVLAKRDGPA